MEWFELENRDITKTWALTAYPFYVIDRSGRAKFVLWPS